MNTNTNDEWWEKKFKEMCAHPEYINVGTADGLGELAEYGFRKIEEKTTMNYELAKKLKDAGFPVKSYRYAADIFKGGFVEPTLSELIEAIGDNFGLLGKRLDGEGFYAVASEFTCDYKDIPISCNGNTPEESVANLWLELNK